LVTDLPSPASPAVAIRGLTRQFGAFTAVEHVTADIAVGEVLGIIGPNGAGKSTLIKMLTTLLPPSAGTAIVAGHDIVRAPAEVRRHIGYVPQLLSADGSLTGYENLLLSARLYAIPHSERHTRITRALARMGLSEQADHLVGGYSGGMIRRLEIAQSLLHRPSILFLDEPTVGLDPAAREAVWEHVLDLRDAFKTTMIVTSHMMEEIDLAAFAPRTAPMDVLLGREHAPATNGQVAVQSVVHVDRIGGDLPFAGWGPFSFVPEAPSTAADRIEIRVWTQGGGDVRIYNIEIQPARTARTPPTFPRTGGAQGVTRGASSNR